MIEGSEFIDLTWGDLKADALRFANLYVERGAAEGDIIFIMLPHCAALYPSFLGAMLTGTIPSFLPPPTSKQDVNIYWETHRSVFSRTSAKCIVAGNALAGELRRAINGLATSVIELTDLGDDRAPLELALILPGSATALLQHSSGTTGLKKGVMLSYDAITAQLESYMIALGAPDPKHMRIASWLPLYHDMGLITSFMLPLYVGAQLVSMDALAWTAAPQRLLELIEEHRCTHTWLPNFAYNHIVRATPKAARYDLTSMQAYTNCSEPCKAETS